MAVIANTDV